MLYVDAAVNTADAATKICPGHPNVLFLYCLPGAWVKLGSVKRCGVLHVSFYVAIKCRYQK